MKTKVLILVCVMLSLIYFVSASGFTNNGYWDEDTQKCWKDENTPPGVYYSDPTDSEDVGLFQCCLNYYGKQIDCNTGEIMYPDEDEVIEEVGDTENNEVEEVINDTEEIEDNEEIQEVIEPVIETTPTISDTTPANQVTETKITSSSKKSSKKSEDKDNTEEVLQTTQEETETTNVNNKVITLRSEETKKGVLVLFIEFISNLFS